MSFAGELINRNNYKKKVAQRSKTVDGDYRKIKSDYCRDRDKILSGYGLTMTALIEITGERSQNLNGIFKRNRRAFEMLVIGSLCCYDRDAKRGAHELIDDIIKLLIEAKTGDNRTNFGRVICADGLLAELREKISPLMPEKDI